MQIALEPDIEVIACPLCGTREHERSYLDENRATRFVRCGRCRTVYLNPRPGAVSRDLHCGDGDGHIRNQLSIAKSRDPAFRLIAKTLRRYKQSGTYLDVGCNTGTFFEHFDRRAWRCYGIEPDAVLAGYASAAHAATVYTGFLNSVDFSTRQFDLVTMIDSIYLVPDPLADMRRMHDLLKPDGLLAVEFAGQAYMLARSVGPINYLLDGRRSRLRTDGRHLYFFTPGGMRELLERAGFKIREWIPIPSPSRPGLRGLPVRVHYTLGRLSAPLSSRFLNYCPKLLCIASRDRSSHDA